MQKEQETLLAILRSTVTGMPFSLDGVDPQTLLHEALMQSVLPLVYDAVCRTDAAICGDRMKQAAFAVVARNMKADYAQKQLIGLLQARGLSYVILKGEAAAAYYPKPELRPLGDVDFLIDPTQRAQVEQTLLDAGYEKNQEGHVCHVVFRKPGAHLEMHFEPAGIPNGEAGEKLRAFFKDATERYTAKDLGGGPFRAPADLYHAMILLLHMQHHMLGEGIGLRHLCDWAYFVEKTAQEPFWQTLLPFLREIGLFWYAAVMSKTCATYLGTRCPDWAEEVPDALCEQVIEDILAGGNFGKKDATRAQSSVLISNRGKDGTGHGKMYYLFYALNAYVKERFRRWRKVWILYPFFYLYVAVRYVFRVATGRRTPLHKLVPAADERKGLYENLHIFETE